MSVLFFLINQNSMKVIVFLWVKTEINKRGGLALLGTISLCILIISLFFIELWLNYNVALNTIVQQSDAVIYIHTHILFHIYFPYGLSQDIEYSSLCYIVRPCYLSIIYIPVCIY